MQRRIDITAPNAFDQGTSDVVVPVSGTVVSRGALLQHLLNDGHVHLRDVSRCRRFQRGQGSASVTASHSSDEFRSLIGQRDRPAEASFVRQCALQQSLHVR